MRRKISVAGAAASVTKPLSDFCEEKYLRRYKVLLSRQGIFPVASPGLPVLDAESDLLQHVQFQGDQEAKVITTKVKTEAGKSATVKKLQPSERFESLLTELLYRGDTLNVTLSAHDTRPAFFIPGHAFGATFEESCPIGPRPSEVMIVSKMPWKEEEKHGCCLYGYPLQLLTQLFEKFRVPNYSEFYLTNLVKFRSPDWKPTPRAGWIRDGVYLLNHEIKLVQPKVIICLGTEAAKALLGRDVTLAKMEGRVSTFRYNVAFDDSQTDSCWREAYVLCLAHPSSVLRDQSNQRLLENNIARLSMLLRYGTTDKEGEVDHRFVDSYSDLKKQLEEIEQKLATSNKSKVIAVDAEWHGEHPVNPGSYVRTIQLAWAPKTALAIKLHNAGGQPCRGMMADGKLAPETQTLLRTFFFGGELNGVKFQRKRVVGHFFNADLEWLISLGLDVRKLFECPLYDLELTDSINSKQALYLKSGFKLGDSVPAWFRTKYEGGADTGLMAHAIEETANYKLESLAMRYTTAPRYDIDLQEWKVKFCSSNGLAAKDLEGYGECPDEILIPYGCYDADVTLRLYYKFQSLLDADYDGNCCREAFWESQIATPAVLDIHLNGIVLDKNRVDFLTKAFIAARQKLEDELQQLIQWPGFNLRSTIHVRELLFGAGLNGKRDKITGKPVRIRPDNAKSLHLIPLFDTSKPPKRWSDIQANKKEHEHAPSTNKQVLSLLAQELNRRSDIPSEDKRVVTLLRDYRFLDQVLKTVLRPPQVDAETDEIIYDDEGNYEYTDGLASTCCADGRIRTHIYQTKETGRWSSARPNLQNISKQRDPDYKRLLGDRYKHSLRSVLKASKGHVLVEADYVGAELFGMAVMSGDTKMIQHAQNNQLPEDHEDFYDIHSNVAKMAFRLDCAPTKSALEAVGKKHLRIVAKSVIFGIAYGRGAKAIAVAAKEQGIDITVEEAQEVIETIFKLYPGLVPFFADCSDRARGLVENSRFICNCFGRYRRFPESYQDEALAAEFSRQAMNFPIQSMIASAVSRALAYLYDYRKNRSPFGPKVFRILLQIHDAVLLEVPYRYVEHVCEEVLPVYMREAVPIYPTKLDGTPTGAGPFHLGIEVEVMKYWGEKLKADQAKAIGIPTGVGGKLGSIVHYSK